MASGGSAAWPLEVGGCSPTSVIGTTHESPTSARLVRVCQSDTHLSRKVAPPPPFLLKPTRQTGASYFLKFERVPLSRGTDHQHRHHLRHQPCRR